MYTAAIRSRPAHGVGYHNIGTVHQRLDRLDEARAMYAMALPLAARVANVYISLASLPRPPASTQLFHSAIELQPSDAEGYARLAVVLAPPLLSRCSAQRHYTPPTASMRLSASSAAPSSASTVRASGFITQRWAG